MSTLSPSYSKVTVSPLANFLRESLEQVRASFIGDPATFRSELRDSLSHLRATLPPDSPYQAFLWSNCQAVAGLSLSSLQQLLEANGLPSARFMGEPPPTFDCVMVAVEPQNPDSGYIFFWEADLPSTEVYFLLAHAWGHLALGHLRQSDKFSHWDNLADLKHPAGPARRWDQAVQAQIALWFEPLERTLLPDPISVEQVEWRLPGWSEAFERLKLGQLDDSAWPVLAAVQHYSNQLLRLDFDILDQAELFPHQRRGAVELAGRLQRLGVALLADSVGLGKTRTTATLIRLLYQNGLIKQAAILTPQKLEHNWRTELQHLGLQLGQPGDKRAEVVLVNKDKFKRWETSKAYNMVEACDLLVIEEAHQDLRNFNNKFHRNLSAVAKGKLGLLVTATPWNNRRGDIFAMLYPFAVGAPGPERPTQTWACFSLSVKDGLREFETNNETFHQIYNLTTLQRTRRQLRESGETSVFYAPRRPYLIDVPYTDEQTRIFGTLLDKIQQLRLPHINFLRYLADDDTENHLSGLQRFSLLKRAESSMYAFEVSLSNLALKSVAFLKELQQLEDTPEAVAQWVRRRSKLEEEQAQSEENSQHEINPEVSRPIVSVTRTTRLLGKMAQENRLLAFRHRLMRDCAHDLQIVRSIQQEFSSLLAHDPKLEAILEQVNKAIAAGHKVLCISQYSDTARSVYQFLLKQPLLAQKGIGLVTGGKLDGVPLIQINGYPSKREEILTRFAPLSWASSEQRSAVRNSTQTKLPANIDILVGSDTLSVGQNLQDARVLLNLDLCWNPMQHEQRIGRIDRPRAVSDSVPLDIYYFLNLELIESELRLQSTLERRLTAAYQDTEFDDEILPGYFEMIQEFRRLRQEQASDKSVVAEANNVLEDIAERSARPPQTIALNTELEREALLQLQTAANGLAQTSLPADFAQKLPVTLGQVVLHDPAGRVRSNLPQMALAAELEFVSLDVNRQPLGSSVYRHFYLTLHQPTGLEEWQIGLEDTQIAPFIEGLLAPSLMRPLGGVALHQLQVLLEHLQDYAGQELDFQLQALKKQRRVSRTISNTDPQPQSVVVRLATLKCLVL